MGSEPVGTYQPLVVYAYARLEMTQFVDSVGVNVGWHEFSSIENAVPKFRGKPDNFPFWVGAWVLCLQILR